MFTMRTPRSRDPLPPSAALPLSRGRITLVDFDGISVPLSRKKDRKSFVFDSPSSFLLSGRPTGRLEILVRGTAAEGGRGSQLSRPIRGRPLYSLEKSRDCVTALRLIRHKIAAASFKTRLSGGVTLDCCLSRPEANQPVSRFDEKDNKFK